ncbi:zinc finger BED domain-containing protein RICESLEEPER 2-like [Brassica rapa]|uniref:zinc finger BED domain-containing protein RICESLEEPER 2-like n=1 Tax=Brassica campestris TaxID=3711 RepID=UPI00142E1B96|nr:zinc finger BED domain-containing protein RICESLEEPER 2-like [Brassica rapa]XP_033140590.1 zinc finger BED domain-containing protein RICESLEEPER 2-like [Brassica rapa]
MGSRSQPEDQSTFDPNYTPPNTVDFATQAVLATLAAAAEAGDQIASQEAGVTRADGKHQGSRKRLISLVDDTDDSDVEISQPTQKTKPRRQTSFRTATGKPMLQSTIDGGVGSSAQACSKGKSVPMKSVIRGGRRKSPTKSKKKKVSPTQSQKKKEKVAEDIPELGDELDEEEFDEDEIGEEEREERQKSDVWKDFKVVEKPNGKLKAACNHCKHEYAWQSHSHGTSGLRRHRERCKMYPRNRGRQQQLNIEGKVVSRKYDHTVFRQMVAKTIVQHDLPYSYVEYERVRDTWKYLNADVQTICRNTARADVYRLYESERDTLKRELATLPGRVSFTSDLWTSVKREGYMCVTAHYIDRNWKLNSKILTFCALPPPHTGMSIAVQLLTSLKEWGIDKKVFSVTLDNATSNDSMQDIVKSQLNLNDDLLCGGEFFHVRCAAHILNLIVQDGLKVIGDSLQKVRESVKYVLGSESREQLFQKCVDAAGVVESGWLILDVSTRWNSTYYMLERALKYRKAFVKLETFDKKGYKTAPTDEEWTRAANICDFLGPFAVITSLMSGSNYPTANLYFYQVWLIHDWLRGNEESADEIVRYMVRPMKEKFDKYWDEVSGVFAMAAVFDPQFKLSIVECCLGKLDISTRDAKVKNLRDKLSILFETYDKNSKNNSPSTEPRDTVPQKACAAGSMGLFGNYNDFFAFRKVSGIVSGKTPLEAYLEEPPLDITNFQSLDILDWWKDNAHRYGDLAAMACDLLSIPITTVASESSFSIGSRVLNKYRSRLLPENVQALICTRNWIKGYESYAHDEEIDGDGEEEKLPTFESIVDGEDEDE